MAKTTEINSTLLLCPQQILKNSQVLQSLHIKKISDQVNYDIADLNGREVNKYFFHLPAEVRDILPHFCEDHNTNREHIIQARYKTGRAGIAFNEFYQGALLREYHKLFERLKPFASLLKWYHKIWLNKTNVKTAPCVFSSYRPQLCFEVIKENDELKLETYIHLNGKAFNINEFKRYQFLLESNNEYFLLSFKDHQTLEWLSGNDPRQYSRQPHLLAQHILAKLEADYKVNRNGLFQQNYIEVSPVNRIMLSELSGSFLMITPQWIYEGFLVDGPWKETYETTISGEAYIVKRNKEEEQRFAKLLEGLHPNFVKQVNGYYYLSFADAQKKQWFLRTYHFLLEQDIQVAGMDMLQHFRYSAHKAGTATTITENNNNTLTVKLALSFGKEVPLADLQKILLAGQRAIMLKDGSLGILGDEWIRQYNTIIKHGKIIKNEITVPRWMAITEEKDGTETELLKPVLKKEWWHRWLQWQQSVGILYAVPKGIKAALRPYQH